MHDQNNTPNFVMAAETPTLDIGITQTSRLMQLFKATGHAPEDPKAESWKADNLVRHHIFCKKCGLKLASTELLKPDFKESFWSIEEAATWECRTIN